MVKLHRSHEFTIECKLCDYFEKTLEKIGIFRINFEIFRDKIGIYRHFLENFWIDFLAIFLDFYI